MRGLFATVAALTALATFLLADEALAWGPVAHLGFAVQLLSGAVVLSPSILALIRAYRDDFLHGNLAADGIVGKNRAKDHDHCHNWGVARKLLERSREEGDDRYAMMLGYVAHLGADVVAHNHIVPRLLITHYRNKGVGHLYWEARADERMLALNPELKATWRDLSSRRFPEHDRFLARQLVPTLFSNKVSAGLWKSGLLMQRNWPWRGVLKRIDAKSALSLEQEELALWERLSVEAARKALSNPFSRRLDNLDPTGREALSIAGARRKQLRRKLKSTRKNGCDLTGLKTEHEQALIDAGIVDISMFEED